MLILDKSSALDRMIWTAGRHAVMVPEQFSSAGAPPSAVLAPTTADLAPWRWREAEPALDRGPRRLSSALELRAAEKRTA